MIPDEDLTTEDRLEALEAMFAEAKFVLACLLKVAGGKVVIPDSVVESMEANPTILREDVLNGTMFSIETE